MDVERSTETVPKTIPEHKIGDWVVIPGYEKSYLGRVVEAGTHIFDPPKIRWLHLGKWSLLEKRATYSVNFVVIDPPDEMKVRWIAMDLEER